MARALTYTELIEYAQKHYDKGGDSIVECWDENTFNEYVKMFGCITKRKALNMFRMHCEIDAEYKSTVW